MVVYNLYKYYIILMRKFLTELHPAALLKLYPNRKWQEYSQTRQYK